MKTITLIPVLLASIFSFTSCTGADDDAQRAADRDRAIQALQQRTGAPVAIEVNEAGTNRVVAMTPRFPAPTRIADPAQAAAAFVTTHHDVFQLSRSDAASFVVTGVDAEPQLGVTHVHLQRQVDGIPVFEGGIQAVMDGGNNVVRVTADDLFRV